MFCGLKRDDNARLIIGSDGFPIPDCVSSTDASASACGRLGIRPLSANFSGGSGSSQGWSPIQVNGIFPNGSLAGAIASIGSDGYSGGPAYFAGNGSDASVNVKVCRLQLRRERFTFDTLFLQFIVSAVADSVLQCVSCRRIFSVVLATMNPLAPA